jgi:hypothetical protein
MLRIMYIEEKSGLSGDARIGRVKVSAGGRSLSYQGKRFNTLNGRGFKANYYEAGSGASYWISGCKKRGGDRLYPGVIHIDEDVREEYWVKVRNTPGEQGPSHNQVPRKNMVASKGGSKLPDSAVLTGACAAALLCHAFCSPA